MRCITIKVVVLAALLLLVLLSAAAQGQRPNFGPIATFNSGSTVHISVSRLMDGKFVVAYVDSGNSGQGTAIIGEINGNTITFGSEYVFNPANTQFAAVDNLSVGSFVVVYRDSGNSNYGTAVAGSVSGTTITFGSETVFNYGITQFPSVAALGSNKFVAAYQDQGNNYYGTAVVGTVSGTTITFGSEYVFNADTTGGVSVAKEQGSVRFLVAYRDNGNLDRGTAVRGLISGTGGNEITYGSEQVFNYGATGAVSITSLELDTPSLVIAFEDQANSSYGTTVVATPSFSPIYGSDYVFNSAGTDLYQSFGIARLSDTRFVVGYENGSDSDGRVRIGDVSGKTINYGSQTSFNTGSSSSNIAVSDSGGNIVVCWVDESDGGKGKCRLGSLSPINPGIVQLLLLP
ncbi:MAG TPA: hypothetical protein PK874_12670 [Desulfobacteraceae bacterium]|nr:hypothetical protein [Desulfobacteraceae bacterium]HPJ67526.1 hypothetical protein [Desulfobacteraceae bacterium]HPQ29071.1 hypothetical protein [Desulfobacteraceae bacterium]